jgi:glutamate N-acetyltransferase/amino-acid N-acetyltransferase
MIKGIKIATTNCGIKYKNRDDLLLVVFENEANVAGVFTSSSMPAAPVTWCKKNIEQGLAKALVVNAGNANAFTGKTGEETVLKTAKKVADQLNCKMEEVFISSTGVIGETLNAELITSAIGQMLQNLESGEKAFDKASRAIMTTDTKPKLIKKTCEIDGKEVNLIGFAKGSGMIAPNMATMLGYIFTDADISSETLQILLKNSTEESFNSITVDSDQSTNDTVFLFATKKAGNITVTDSKSSEIASFKEALNEVSLGLAKMIVVDGEGAKKVIEIEVEGATSKSQA